MNKNVKGKDNTRVKINDHLLLRSIRCDNCESDPTPSCSRQLEGNSVSNINLFSLHHRKLWKICACALLGESWYALGNHMAFTTIYCSPANWLGGNSSPGTELQTNIFNCGGWFKNKQIRKVTLSKLIILP